MVFATLDFQLLWRCICLGKTEYEKEFSALGTNAAAGSGSNYELQRIGLESGRRSTVYFKVGFIELE